MNSVFTFIGHLDPQLPRIVEMQINRHDYPLNVKERIYQDWLKHKKIFDLAKEIFNYEYNAPRFQASNER